MRRSLAALALLASLCASCAPATDDAPPPPSARCVGCHLDDFRAVRSPRHVGVKPTTCGVCHSQQAWSPSVVRHGWPLTGAHAEVPCFRCHDTTPPVFEGTPTACMRCHRADFDRSEFPGHARFPTACARCHGTAAWKPARRPAAAPPAPPATPAHPAVGAPRPRPVGGATPAPPSREPQHPEARFPIRAGNHADIECRTCHDQGGAMGRDNTDCVQCHARSRYDRIHRRVRDYPDGVASAHFCVTCHTRGTRSRR